MKKPILLFLFVLFFVQTKATIHIVKVWDGYFQFVDQITFSRDITINLGDTVHWLPLDYPSMPHTITSTSIPAGAASFDQIWQAPADTFFQYIPSMVGLYEYECTPHAVSHNMKGTITVLNVSGVSEYSSTASLNIYPSPASDYIYISEASKGNLFNIYDIKGALIKSGIYSENVNIKFLFNGVYIIEIILDKPRYFRFVKN